ncbi:hypothetical protein ABWH96_08165 [Marivirga tractuosa]|uniref:toxin-antitoxin system YwqK family antitoxin n=1 Tax=Marivirga tractuosa TaxID=1006 RepID=UPI0035D06163
MSFKQSTWLFAFTFILLLTTKLSLLAQSDTTWYDASGYITNLREKAVYYSFKPIKIDSGYRVEEFYISGQKKMEGFSTSADGQILEGWAIWYYENGDISEKVFYEKGNREKCISYWEGEKFSTAEYRNNKPYEGTFVVYAHSRSAYLMPTYRQGSLESLYIFENDPEGIRFGYTLTIDNDQDTLRNYKFYDEKGDLLGKYECVDQEFEMYADEEDKLKKNGTFVDYYTDPMQVGAIIKYKKGNVLSRKDYYRTGELREEVIIEGETATAKYYKLDGTLLGEFSGPYNIEYDYFKRGGTGTKVDFYDDKEGSHMPVREIVKKEDGENVEKKFYARNGNLKRSIKFGDNGDRVEKRYNDEGKQSNELIWKNNDPYHGTFVQNSMMHKIYEKGEMTGIIHFYKSGEKFRNKRDSIATYYNKEGDVIAKATFESLESEKPIEGTVMELFNAKLRYEKHYKHGKEIKKVEYFHYKYPLRISKKETFYDDGRRTREKWYYSTGDLRSDFIYDGYRRKAVTYYDKDGKVIGKLGYSNRKEIGTEVKFFYESDLIREVTKYDEEGEMLTKKIFDKRYDEDKVPYTILEADIQSNGKSKYYAPDGSKLAEAEFRGGEPFSGVIVEHPSYNADYDLYIIKPFKEGEVHGIVKEMKYYDKEPYQPVVGRESVYKEGQRNGVDKIYYPNGELRIFQHYKNGQLHGKYISYDENGNVEEQYSYKEGKPYDGLFKNSIPYTRDIDDNEYKISKGNLVYCNFKLDGRLLEKTKMVDGKYETVIYKENGADSITLMLDENRNGSVMLHGREKRKSENIIKDGEPWSGTFYFTDFDKRETEVFGETEYLKISLDPYSWKLIAYNMDGEEVFQLAEQKNWKESNVISRYIWVDSYLKDLSFFYKHRWSTFN